MNRQIVALRRVACPRCHATKTTDELAPHCAACEVFMVTDRSLHLTHSSAGTHTPFSKIVTD